MHLDKLAIVLRPRANWEAVDLGIRMVQNSWQPLFAAWLAVYLPISLLVVSVIGVGLESLMWAVLVLWCLKPFFDAVLLHVLSHAIFGDVTDWRTTWRALPQLLLRSGLINVTLQRIAPPWLWWCNTRRSLLLPVTQLEGLRGKAARERRRLLSRQVGGVASWLTFAVVNFEFILFFAVMGFVSLALPDSIKEQFNPGVLLFGRNDDPQLIARITMALVDVAILGFLEPFYVACGFALYLKRRTDLEAWDVELAFRRLQTPPKSPGAATLTSMVLAGVLIASLFLSPSITRAETVDDAHRAVSTIIPASSDIADRAKTEIDEILKRPEFGTEYNSWRLRKIVTEEPKSDLGWLDRVLRAIGKAFRLIGQWISEIGRVLAWTTLVILVAVFGWAIYRYWRQHAGNIVTNNAPPAEVAGFDIRPESLPDDVAAAALALARAGQPRACLSLLYRAALSTLAHRDRVEFTRGDTEGDCLQRVHGGAPIRYSFFSHLTLAWQEVAYARHELPREQLENLCAQWPQYFAIQP